MTKKTIDQIQSMIENAKSWLDKISFIDVEKEQDNECINRAKNKLNEAIMYLGDYK